MQTITQGQLVRLLEGQKGATPASLFYDSTLPDSALKSPKKLGTSGRIRKIGNVNVILNHVYGNSVNLQRQREGKEADFSPMARKWGERVQGTTLVTHKGSFYVECKIERNLFGPEYLLDGMPMKKADIECFIRQKSELEKRIEKLESRQKVDKPVILRDFRLDNIVRIHMLGEQYYVV